MLGFEEDILCVGSLGRSRRVEKLKRKVSLGAGGCFCAEREVEDDRIEEDGVVACVRWERVDGFAVREKSKTISLKKEPESGVSRNTEPERGV